MGDGAGDEGIEGGALEGHQRGEAGGGDLVGGAAREKRAGESDDVALTCDGELTVDLGIECSELRGGKVMQASGGAISGIELRGKRWCFLGARRSKENPKAGRESEPDTKKTGEERRHEKGGGEKYGARAGYGLGAMIRLDFILLVGSWSLMPMGALRVVL